VAGDAAAEVERQDFSKSADCVAVGAWLRIGLGQVTDWVDLDGVVDSSADESMVVTIKIGSMA